MSLDFRPAQPSKAETVTHPAPDAGRPQLALVAVVLAGAAEAAAPVPVMVTVPGVGEDAAA